MKGNLLREKLFPGCIIVPTIQKVSPIIETQYCAVICNFDFLVNIYKSCVQSIMTGVLKVKTLLNIIHIES